VRLLECAAETTAAADIAVATDPSVDVNNLVPNTNEVYDQLIAFFVLSSAVSRASRVFSYPVLLGESVFVSADGFATVTITYELS